KLLKLRKALPVMRTITVVRNRGPGRWVRLPAHNRWPGHRSSERKEARAMHTAKSKRTLGWKLAAGALPTVALFTRCQAEYAGQTLPSPWYLTDDVQYYAPGPEFKLAREAAAMKEQSEAVQSRQQAAQGLNR